MTDLSKTPWKKFPAGAAPDDLVSTDFQLYELTKFDLASRREIPNDFASVDEMRCAVYLCRNVMQPVREKFGRYSPNSVYRTQALERALKDKPAEWISTSQHVKGQACDIEVLSAPDTPDTYNLNFVLALRAKNTPAPLSFMVTIRR